MVRMIPLLDTVPTETAASASSGTWFPVAYKHKWESLKTKDQRRFRYRFRSRKNEGNLLRSCTSRYYLEYSEF